MMFRFLRHTSAIQKQLAGAEGAVGFSVRASPLTREFWTLSVWTDRGALMKFTRNLPHSQVMKSLEGHMRKTVFIEWQCKGSELPPSWKSALRRFEGRQAG
jgi:quinol monooxygenase YgiN